MQTDIHFWSYLAQLCLQRETFQTKVVQKIETHILCSVTFFRKSCRLWDNVEKYFTTGLAHAHCVLDTEGYRHTHKHTLQQWMHERVWNVTLHVDCLSCYVRVRSCFWSSFLHFSVIRESCCYSNSLPATHVLDPHRCIHHSPLALHLFVLQYTSGGSLQLCLIDYSQTKNYSWSISHLTPTRAPELNNDKAHNHTQPHGGQPLQWPAFVFVWAFKDATHMCYIRTWCVPRCKHFPLRL